MPYGRGYCERPRAMFDGGPPERGDDVLRPPSVDADRRVRAFFAWLALAGFVFGAGCTVAGVWLGSTRLALVSFASLGFGVAGLEARRLAGRGDTPAGVAMVCIALTMAGTFDWIGVPEVRVIPLAIPTLVLLIALPFVPAARTKLLFLGAFAWALLMIAIGPLLPKGEPLPGGFVKALEASADLAAVGLSLLLLRSFIDRMQLTLARQRRAEARYRTLVDQLPAVIFIDEITGPGPDDIRPLYISPKVEAMFGYPVETWLTDPGRWDQVLHPEDHDRVRRHAAEVDRLGEPFSEEYRIVAADGRAVWVHEEAVCVPDERGDPRYWQGVMFDVTETKLAQQQVEQSFDLLKQADEERRHLLEALVSAQEEERRMIADEIHDDPVQKMTAVNMRLHTLARNAPDPETRSALEEFGSTVEGTIVRLRRLLFELRPVTLDHSGLAAAIREFVAQLEDLGECRVEEHLDDEPPDPARTIAYRIAVEALSNVQRHARAGRVDVELFTRDGGVQLVVRDDGVGMSEETLENRRPGHLGMTSLRERAQLAGGWSRISSAPGEGTCVEAWLPTNPNGSTPESADLLPTGR